jgi:hypothetical protein
LNTSFPNLLNEFVNAYVQFNTNPSNTAYQSMLNSIKASIMTSINNLTSTSNNLNSESSKLVSVLENLNASITQEQKKNAKLSDKLDLYEKQNTSTGVLINDYKTIYNLAYVQNWGLFLSIIVSISFYSFYRIKNKK